MSTSYNSNVPNPPDAPSADVGPMHTNASGIANWCGQYDHYGLNNVANTGLHKQITFGGVNSPAGPADPVSILYTKNDSASKPQLFFLNSQNSGYYTAGGTGSAVLLGGIIIKWGLANVTPTTVVFATQFPNNCFNVQATTSNSGTQVNITAVSATQFSAASSPSSSSVNFYWFAIGN